MAYFRNNLLDRWWTSLARWVKLWVLRGSYGEEATLATEKSLAPLNKEAAKKQRKTVVALKQARKNNKNGRVRAK